MKRLLIVMLAVFMAVMAYAQKPMSGSRALELPIHKAIATQRITPLNAGKLANKQLAMPYMANAVRSQAPRRIAEQVTPPTGEVIYYTLQGTNNSGSGLVSRIVKVIFDGNDVYVTGLCWYVADAWAKGTIENGVATFAMGQYMGDPGAEVYLAGTDDGSTLTDVIANYDVETRNFEFTTYILDNKDVAEGLGFYAYWSTGVTLTKIEDDVDLPVEAPEGLETEEFIVKGLSYAYNEQEQLITTSTAFYVQVGFVTTSPTTIDIYVQGLCYSRPEAWVKGTGEVTGSKIKVTFPTGQLLGTYASSYVMWFIGLNSLEDEAELQDVVFDFDADSKTLTLLEGQYVAVNGKKDEYNWNNIYSDLVISKVVEVAAMPANPEITDLKNSNYGHYITFNVPAMDTEGNGLVSSKLFYQIYTDIEGEVSALTFTPQTHVKLTEDMTAIPYGFTEDYDFDFVNNKIYLNDLYSADWNKLGIKSIYYGGGETNETEIQWYEIKPYGGDEAGHLWIAEDQGYNNQQTITDITIDEGITGVFAQGNGANPSRYYNKGSSVRTFAGNTLTLTSEGEAIVKVKFAFDTNNGAKMPAFNVEVGEMTIAEDGITGEWTGETNEIVFSVPNTSGQQARVQSIRVILNGEVAPNLVVLQDLIETAETTYPEDDMGNVRAYPDTKAAFLTVLADAKAEAEKTDGHYRQAYEALKAAVDALNTSVEEYNTLENIYNNWNENIANMKGKWATIEEDDAFTQIMDEIGDALDNCTYTSEQIAAADSRLAEAFSIFIGSLVEKGDDLTFLLNNPSFDDKDANGNYIKFSGWDSDWVNPTWGGEDVEYTDPADPSGMTTKIAEGGNAEVYHAKFNIHQTIKYMPAGVFTLSCKAFERDDNSQGVNAELYAIVNGDIQNIQTVKVKNRDEEGSDVMLYDGIGGTNGKNADVINGGKYVPGGMSGANVYFNEGFYENYLNIVLEEPAEEIIIGIRNLTGGETWNSSGDWVLFDDFQIVFNGNSGSSYFPTLQRLINQANTYTAAGAEYILTTEALNALANAIKNAQNLMKNEETSTESALDAIAQLEGAIELTKETIALTDKLNYYIEVMDLRMSDELIATSDTSIEDVISEIRGHLDNNDYEDKAAVEQAMIDLNKAFTKYVMYDHAGATEANPADVTPVIYNYDGNEYSYSTTVNGWDQIEGTVGYGNSEGEVSEFFDTSFEISQTLYGLLPGWYRLGVQGYYRAGLGTAVKEQYEAGEELARHAVLFAGDEAETPLLGITNMEDMTVFTMVAEGNGTEGTVELVEGLRIPDTAAQGATALQNFREDETPLYQNYLQFEVKEGQESVTIGLRKTEEVEKDWCVWDNWSLLYYGTGQSQEPIIDPNAGVNFGGAVTAIEADTWYYLYQARGGGSYCMEGEIPSGGGGLMTDCGDGEDVLKKDFTPLLSHVSTETAAPYLVRFVKEDETDDVYRIQFGTGNYLTAPNGTGNGKKFTTSSTIDDAGTFNVYAIEEGTAYFALNVCDDRGDYQELIDNNGTGYFIATWDSGKKTNVGGNSVWSIHEVILNGEEENGDDVTINVDMNHGNWIEWNNNSTFPFARSWNSTTTPKISVCCTTGGRTTTDIRGNKFSGGNNMSAYGDDKLNLMFYSNLSTYQVMVEEGYYIKSVDFDFDATAWTSAKSFYDFPEESGLSITPEDGEAVVSTNPYDIQHISWTNEDNEYSIYTFTYSVNRVGSDNGFARTSNFVVVVAPAPDEGYAMQQLEATYNQYSQYENAFTAGTKPGQYSEEAVVAFQEALTAASYSIGPDSEGLTVEQLNALAQAIIDTYNDVLTNKVPISLASGYYHVKTGMRYSQEEVDPVTGEIVTKYYNKYMYSRKNGETIKGEWGSRERLDESDAPSLWKVTNKGGILIDMVNMATDARYTTPTAMESIEESEDALLAVEAIATDEDDITYVNLRMNGAAPNAYNYLHQGGHSSGKGKSGNVVAWCNTWSENGAGASEWVFVPVDEATAAAIIEAYQPIKNRELMLEEFYNLLAVAKEDLETAIDIQHVKLIQSADQLSSPCSDSEEGQHIENLIDENTSTFWHSDWHGDYEGGTHYFQVEMPENITMPIHATFTRRNSSVYQITQWGIYGTNNAEAETMESCELLLEWDTPFNSQTETLTSPEFETKGFKYLRMYCLAQSSNSNAFFHLSEFQLGYDVENPEAPFYYMGKYGTNLQKLIEQLSLLEREDIFLDDYNALKVAHDEFLDKLSWMDYPIVNLQDGNVYDFDTDTDVKRVTYTRNYKNKNWQALYLPFEIDYEDWANDFDLARINDTHQFDDDDDGVIDRTELEVIKLRSGHTEAHTPYLIRAKKTGEKTIMANCTTLYAAEERSYDVSSWNTLYTFTGTYTGVPGETMLGNGYYAFGGGSLHQAADVTNALSPYRWYMEITDRNGNPKNLGEVKVVVFDMDDMDETDEADGIKWQMSNGKCEMENGDGALYDLSGRRVTNPRQGIYVRNGRKIIIK